MKNAVALVAAFLFSSAVSAQQPAAPATVLKAARVIDGAGASFGPGVVVVNGEKIVAAGKEGAVTVPAGARTIDLGDVTLLPGLIDAHTHIGGRSAEDPGSDVAIVRDLPAYSAILGVANAEKTLLAGFTTIRVVGEGNFDDIALRQAIDEGKVPGPRMRVAGHSIGITGGHCDTNGFRPGLVDADYKQGVADGVDQVRAAVRYQVKYGADVIKICATGGVLSEGDAVGATQYTLEEMRAIVEEAHKLERKVAAHAHGAEGIRLATQAGVDSIEHGSFLDAEGAKLMKQRGTYLVPTLIAGETVENLAKKGVLKGLRAEKAIAAAAAMRNAVKVAREHGVQVAFGTDAGVFEHGMNAHEFWLLVHWGGMTPMEAILTSTRNAAKLLGWDDRIGSLSSGKYADIIAVSGDPLTDITALQKVVFVMKNGVVYKQVEN